MKTLDEVIYHLENCAYAPLTDDALQYLKAYRDDKDDLTALRAYYAEQQANPALSWDELKAMEGKPVWVEEENQPSQWYLIGDVETDEDDDPEFVSMIVYDCQWDYLFYKNNMGTKWQAYRKERHE